jgi:hypothetical protein
MGNGVAGGRHTVGMIVRDAMDWLSILILLVGVIACALYLARTRWAGVLMAGFALQLVGLGFARVLALVARHGFFGGARVGFTLAQLLGVLGTAAVVGGVVGTLAEHGRVAGRRTPGA